MSSVKMSSVKMDKSEVRPGKNVIRNGKSYLKVTVTCPLWVPDCDPPPVLRSNADDALVCGDVCDTELQLVDPSQASNGLGRPLTASRHKSPGSMSPKSFVEESQGMRITQLVSPVSPRMRGESAIATAGAMAASEASASALCGVVGHAAWSSRSNKSAYCKAIVFVDDALLGPLQIERENSPQHAASMRSPSSLMQRRISGQSEHYLQVSTITPKSPDSSPLSPTIPPAWHAEVLRKVGEQSATARQTLVQRYAVENRYRNRTDNADIGTPLPYQVRQNRKTTGLWRSREISPPSAGQRSQSVCVDKKCRGRMTVPVPLPLVSPKPSFMCDTQISDPLSAHALSPPESPDASPSSLRRPNTAEVSTPRSRRTRNVCPRMTAPSVSASHYRPIEVNGDSFANKDDEQPPCDSADGVAACPATAPVVRARGTRARVKDKERISVLTAVMTGYYVNVANVGRQPETVLESLLQVTGTKAARTSPGRDHGLD